MRVHSSWHGIGLAFLSPCILLLIGTMGLAGRSFHVVPAFLLVGGLALLGVALLDFPTSTTFRPEGIERRAPLRRQLLAWPEVSELRRVRGSPRRDARGAPPLVPVSRRTGPRPSGLVAVRGRRSYLLSDQPEAAIEYDALLERFGRWGVDVHVTAVRPPDGLAPTWLYRPKRWRTAAR